MYSAPLFIESEGDRVSLFHNISGFSPVFSLELVHSFTIPVASKAFMAASRDKHFAGPRPTLTAENSFIKLLKAYS